MGDDAQQLTMVNQPASSIATCNVIAIGVQNKKQRARYDHEKMWLWFDMLSMATCSVWSMVPFLGRYGIAT